MRTIQVCMVHGDIFKDDLMHHFDVFEDSKRLVEVTCCVMEITDNVDLQSIIYHVRKTWQELGHFVAAAFVVNSDIGYVDETVKVISDGQRWGMLQDVLDEFGYQHAAVSGKLPASFAKQGA